MLTSLALIFLLGMFLGSAFNKFKLPNLLGMLLTGIILGPYALNLLDISILSISADLRELALIIILIRAGLSLDIADLQRVGRPALLMCFIPACFEITGMILIAPRLLGISILDATITGAVVGAVSPAIIVPKMLFLMETNYGTDKRIIKAKSENALASWMSKISLLGVPELNAFVNGLKQDIDAVMNATRTDFSNGLAEGTINKIKTVKRIMYGRCHFSLLRSKCLLLNRPL